MKVACKWSAMRECTVLTVIELKLKEWLGKRLWYGVLKNHCTLKYIMFSNL